VSADGFPRVQTIVRVEDANGHFTTLTSDSALDVGGSGEVSGLPTDLSFDSAAELTARIGRSLEGSEELIAKAYLGRAWKALGFASWDGWVDHHFHGRPLLSVRKQDRVEAVLALDARGLSGRTIARAVEIDERTVRRYLSGAANAAPGAVVIGADGKEYPKRRPLLAIDAVCDVCQVSDAEHEAKDCPEVAGLFEAITAVVGEVDRSQRFGRGGVVVEAGTGDEDLGGFGLGGAQESGEDDDDVDSEWEPFQPRGLGLGDTDPDAVALRRNHRLRVSVGRLGVIRDDIEELPRLLELMAGDVAGWPVGSSVVPPADLRAEFGAVVAALRRLLPTLEAQLVSAERLAVELAGGRV